MSRYSEYSTVPLPSLSVSCRVTLQISTMWSWLTSPPIHICFNAQTSRLRSSSLSILPSPFKSKREKENFILSSWDASLDRALRVVTHVRKLTLRVPAMSKSRKMARASKESSVRPMARVSSSSSTMPSSTSDSAMWQYTSCSLRTVATSKCVVLANNSNFCCSSRTWNKNLSPNIPLSSSLSLLALSSRPFLLFFDSCLPSFGPLFNQPLLSTLSSDLERLCPFFFSRLMRLPSSLAEICPIIQGLQDLNCEDLLYNL
mmetsp:Transcript_42145/g.82789  ORF Transcript_42145/g.82789 Transcript_42145/m.82789 type:complete len:259 (-) Transcript_42145:49-825(-)